MNKLHLSPEAQADLAGIKEYITDELENPSAADATVRKITKQIRTLREHGLIGTPLAAVADVESDYRFLVSGQYLTFYAHTAKIFISTVFCMDAGIICASCLAAHWEMNQLNKA